MRSLSKFRQRLSSVLAHVMPIFSALACTPGAATKPLAEPPALPDAEACDAATLGGVVSPYVLNWPTSTRGDLEDAMNEGVVVVHYGCDGVRVLPDCRVEGTYGYRAVTPKRESALVQGEDSLRATFGGLHFGVDASVSRGARIDMSYVLVGKRSTARARVTRGDLGGGAYCEGATHFVKRADVGAWSLVEGTDVKAGMAAEVMGQGAGATSNSSQHRTKTDGNAGACEGATRGDSDAPEGCASLILVSLAPIHERASATDIAKTGLDDTHHCPRGMALSEGAGCQPMNEKNVVCPEGDKERCFQRCEQGSVESCARLARHVIYTEMAGSKDKQEKVSHLMTLAPLRSQLEASCEAAHAVACRSVANLILATLSQRMMDGSANKEELKVSFREARPPLARACEFGDPEACLSYRVMWMKNAPLNETVYGVKGLAADWIGKLDWGCRGGAAMPCGYLAFELAEGQNTPRDLKRAQRLAHTACLGDWADGCLLELVLARATVDDCQAAKSFGRGGFANYKLCGHETVEAMTSQPDVVDAARERFCQLRPETSFCKP